MSNLPNPYFHSPMNRYPTPPPGPPDAWTTAPENDDPDEPQKPRRSKKAIVIASCTGLAALIVALALLL